MLEPLLIITVCSISLGIYDIASAGIFAVVMLHCAKADEPILVTLSGIVMLVSKPHP